ncbi:hypothetical protein A2U01_0081581, partial [Trifolium medium]|nr:hypothetical protein [Trifolium medium]
PPDTLCGLGSPRIQRCDHKAPGICRPHCYLWLQRNCQVDQGQIPGHRLPVILSMHHRQDGHRRSDRHHLYCPSEDEILHS